MQKQVAQGNLWGSGKPGGNRSQRTAKRSALPTWNIDFTLV